MRKGLAITLMLTLLQGAPDQTDFQKMMARFARTELRVDTSHLTPGDQKALGKLLEAAHVIDRLYRRQLWSGNEAMLVQLQRDKSPLGQARLRYFLLNQGPFSELDEHRSFLTGAPEKKPAGANFYPEDMTKEEFNHWAKTLSEKEQQAAEGFFTVIRRDAASRKLKLVRYSQEYRSDLEQAARLLHEAAAATTNASLRQFLNLRAEAFLHDDYYASDVAWMDLDAPLDVTIGPYETYTDELFGYKAAFEAYINLRDDAETNKLQFFANHLQEVENNLPMDPRYRNPKIGALAPIRVVNEILSAGDAAHGVRTAAYNLPNDERVVQQKGSKRVMLKNVQEAKFRSILQPIARQMLASSAQGDLSFEWFFTHILAHELSHGIGPQQIKVGGRDTTARKELKELYSAIEEAKADITGLFMLQYLFDKGHLKATAAQERQLYTTYLASSFRTMRFGLKEAHGKGMAVQANYLMDKGAFRAQPDGMFEVDVARMKTAVRDLTHDLLTLEAEGNYEGAKSMLARLGVLRPEWEKALAKLDHIPTDIEPVFVSASAAK